MRPVIQSTKRITQFSLFTVPEDDTVSAGVLEAKQDFVGGTSECPVGAVVKAVYVEFWLLGEGAQPTFAMAFVEKSQGSSAKPDIATVRDMDNYTNKKNVLHMFQGIIGDSNTNPMPVIRQWIKVPKGKQRMGLGDQIRVVFGGLNPSMNESFEVCGFVIAKYYQ